MRRPLRNENRYFVHPVRFLGKFQYAQWDLSNHQIYAKMSGNDGRTLRFFKAFLHALLRKAATTNIWICAKWGSEVGDRQSQCSRCHNRLERDMEAILKLRNANINSLWSSSEITWYFCDDEIDWQVDVFGYIGSWPNSVLKSTENQARKTSNIFVWMTFSSNIGILNSCTEVAFCRPSPVRRSKIKISWKTEILFIAKLLTGGVELSKVFWKHFAA